MGYTQGVVAASSKLMSSGILAQSQAEVLKAEEKAPLAVVETRSPGLDL